VNVDVVTMRLNLKVQQILNIGTAAVGSLIWLLVAWIAAQVMWDFFEREIVVVGALTFPACILIAFMALGSALLALELLRQTYGHLKKWKAWRKEQ